MLVCREVVYTEHSFFQAAVDYDCDREAPQDALQGRTVRQYELQTSVLAGIYLAFEKLMCVLYSYSVQFVAS